MGIGMQKGQQGALKRIRFIKIKEIIDRNYNLLIIFLLNCCSEVIRFPPFISDIQIASY